MKSSLSFAELVILSQLHEEPMHGYLLWQKLGQHFSRSGMYRALAQLEYRGLIQPAAFAAPDAPKHKAYTISTKGTIALQHQRKALHTLAEAELNRSLENYQKARALLTLLQQEVRADTQFQNSAVYNLPPEQADVAATER